MVEEHATQSLDIAVIGGDGIGPEVVAEGLKVLSAVTADGGPRSRRPTTTSERAGGTPPARPCPDSVAGGDPRSRRDPARRRRRPRRAERCPRAGPPAAPALHPRPLRQPAPGPALPGRGQPPGRRAGRARRHRLRRRARGHRGPLHRQRRCAAGRDTGRGRDGGQRQHPLRRGAGRARRLRPRPGPGAAAPHAGAQAQRAVVRRAPVAQDRGRGRQRVPRRQHRLPARRRGDDLPDHRPRSLRRHRDRQPLRRHHHRHRGGDRRWHRPGRQRQHQPRPVGRRACSSRCTARPRTSPARARPTRPRRSCRWR